MESPRPSPPGSNVTEPPTPHSLASPWWNRRARPLASRVSPKEDARERPPASSPPTPVSPSPPSRRIPNSREGTREEPEPNERAREPRRAARRRLAFILSPSMRSPLSLSFTREIHASPLSERAEAPPPSSARSAPVASVPRRAEAFWRAGISSSSILISPKPQPADAHRSSLSERKMPR